MGPCIIPSRRTLALFKSGSLNFRVAYSSLFYLRQPILVVDQPQISFYLLAVYSLDVISLPHSLFYIYFLFQFLRLTSLPVPFINVPRSGLLHVAGSRWGGGDEDGEKRRGERRLPLPELEGAAIANVTQTSGDAPLQLSAVPQRPQNSSLLAN